MPKSHRAKADGRFSPEPWKVYLIQNGADPGDALAGPEPR